MLLIRPLLSVVCTDRLLSKNSRFGLELTRIRRSTGIFCTRMSGQYGQRFPDAFREILPTAPVGLLRTCPWRREFSRALDVSGKPRRNGDPVGNHFFKLPFDATTLA